MLGSEGTMIGTCFGITKQPGEWVGIATTGSLGSAGTGHCRGDGEEEEGKEGV